MFKQYRPIEKGEILIISADCSQGGEDYNSASFFSRTKLDFPLEYHSRGVAATMTATLHPVIEKAFDVTGIPPLVAFETNNGGSSEMERLSVLNRLNKYRLYRMMSRGQVESNESNTYGFNTNMATRPELLGNWKQAVDNKLCRIYDQTTLKEHLSFIVSERGRPEAEEHAHDDTVFSHAICWYIHINEPMPISTSDINVVHLQNSQKINNWRIG